MFPRTVTAGLFAAGAAVWVTTLSLLTATGPLTALESWTEGGYKDTQPWLGVINSVP